MSLLEYLVPSRARREVLRTLTARGRAFSVRALSRSAGVPYSNAHREVRRMLRLGLLKTRRSGMSLLCSWNPGTPAARCLTRLLRAPAAAGTPSSGVEGLYANLKHWGAPLARRVPASLRLSLEETLGGSLALSRKDPDVAQVWPVVLARHRSRVNLEALESVARREGQKRVLGFLLSLSGELLHDPALTSFAGRLRDQRVRKVQDFFLLDRGGRARRLAEVNSPKVARNWLFRLNTTLEGFQGHLNKFVARS